MESFESTLIKKNRSLAQWLLVSALLNIAFVSSGLYQYYKPSKDTETISSKGQLAEDSTTVLKYFLTLGYPELVSKLTQKSEIEPGLGKRDLALGILSTSYHLDLTRALNRSNFNFQNFSYTDEGKEKAIPICRGLGDADFELISRFIKHETWPFTAEGLFQKLKFGIKETELVHAFFISDSVAPLVDYLKQGVCSISDDELLAMFLKGDYAEIENFNKQLKAREFTLEHFLKHYLHLKSPVAAAHYAALPLFSIKHLSDGEALALLELLPETSEQRPLIAKELLVSFRSDALKEEVKKLGFVSQVQEPKVELVAALPIVKSAPPVAKTATKPSKTYVVQEGDSLWKISRKFKVDIEQLKKVNKLESEQLKPGKVLTIP